jgi:F420H(2)-dependent quinone reductase
MRSGPRVADSSADSRMQNWLVCLGPARVPCPQSSSSLAIDGVSSDRRVGARVGHRARVVCALMSIYESVFRTTLQIHAFIYEHTDGLIGHRVLGVPCLMLRTTGRKTGQTRTNSLVYAKDGDRYMVVASKGGDPKAPAWLLNLRAKPEVEVQIGRTRFPATATEIGLGDTDYARLWKLVNDRNGNRYDAYQKKTTRPIPLVALTRAT